MLNTFLAILRRLFTTPYHPEPDLNSFAARAQTQENSTAQVTVAVLDAVEAARLFGVPLALLADEARTHTALLGDDGTLRIVRNADGAIVVDQPLGSPVPGDPNRAVPNYVQGALYDPHWDVPVLSIPGHGGGADWNHQSYSHSTGLVYTGYGYVAAAHSLTEASNEPVGDQAS